MFEKTKINEKEAGVGSLKKDIYLNVHVQHPLLEQDKDRYFLIELP